MEQPSCKWKYAISAITCALICSHANRDYVGSGLFFFFGGMLQILGSILEWILGNTFPFVVFACYGEYYRGMPIPSDVDPADDEY